MSAIDTPAGYLEIIEEAFATPTREHVVETYRIAQDANAHWVETQRARVALAERIADSVASGRDVEDGDVDRYRALHVEQVAARRARSLAADELVRALEVGK